MLIIVLPFAAAIVMWLIWLPILTYKYGYIAGIKDTTGLISGRPWPKRWFIPPAKV